MRARRWGFALSALFVTTACQDTEECIELRKLLKTSERVMRSAKAMASLADRTGRNLERIRTQTERKLEEQGLDKDEGDLSALLEARIEGTKKVELERTVRPAEVDPRAPIAKPKTETVFRFNLRAKDLPSAWSSAEALMASPPLTRLYSFIAPKRRGKPWRLDLGRIDIQRLPMKFEPRALPSRRSAEDIPSELGFCGAGDLRERISKAEAEIEKLREKAAETTVNLPMVASWKGLSRRTDLAIETETEGRRLVGLLVSAVVASEQRFIALGVEKEAVLLEIAGGARELAAVQSKLPPGVLEFVRELKSTREGVVRLAIGNRVAAAGRRPDKGEGGPGAKPRFPDDPHSGHHHP